MRASRRTTAAVSSASEAASSFEKGSRVGIRHGTREARPGGGPRYPSTSGASWSRDVLTARLWSGRSARRTSSISSLRRRLATSRRRWSCWRRHCGRSSGFCAQRAYALTGWRTPSRWCRTVGAILFDTLIRNRSSVCSPRWIGARPEGYGTERSSCASPGSVCDPARSPACGWRTSTGERLRSGLGLERPGTGHSSR
jgi:hypothetical protein